MSVIYYEVVEVCLDSEGNIQERLIATKDCESKADKLLEFSRLLNPNKKYYISEDDSLDF